MCVQAILAYCGKTVDFYLFKMHNIFTLQGNIHFMQIFCVFSHFLAHNLKSVSEETLHLQSMHEDCGESISIIIQVNLSPC